MRVHCLLSEVTIIQINYLHSATAKLLLEPRGRKGPQATPTSPSSNGGLTSSWPFTLWSRIKGWEERTPFLRKQSVWAILNGLCLPEKGKWNQLFTGLITHSTTRSLENKWHEYHLFNHSENFIEYLMLSKDHSKEFGLALQDRYSLLLVQKTYNK